MKENLIPNHSFWQNDDGSRQLFIADKFGRNLAGNYQITELHIADFSKKKVIVVAIETFTAEVKAGKLKMIG